MAWWILLALLVGFGLGVVVGINAMAYGTKLIKEREPETIRRWLDK